MSDSQATQSRRGFLKLATLAAPAAATAIVAAPAASVADEASTEGEGLRMTPHVKAYLDSARF